MLPQVNAELSGERRAASEFWLDSKDVKVPGLS
jgi:hypothetical protein